MPELFLPRPGWIVRVTQIGPFSAHSDLTLPCAAAGTVISATESTAFPGWLALELTLTSGRYWFCAQCRCHLASAREVA